MYYLASESIYIANFGWVDKVFLTDDESTMVVLDYKVKFTYFRSVLVGTTGIEGSYTILKSRPDCKRNTVKVVSVNKIYDVRDTQNKIRHVITGEDLTPNGLLCSDFYKALQYTICHGTDNVFYHCLPSGISLFVHIDICKHQLW